MKKISNANDANITTSIHSEYIFIEKYLSGILKKLIQFALYTISMNRQTKVRSTGSTVVNIGMNLKF